MALKRKGKISGWFVGGFCICLVLLMPARFALLGATGLDLSQSVISGTWWHGNIEQARYQGIRLNLILAKWSPDWLGMNIARFDITVQSPLLWAKGYANFLADGRTEITDVDFQVNLSHLPASVTDPYGVSQVSGRVTGVIPVIYITENFSASTWFSNPNALSRGASMVLHDISLVVPSMGAQQGRWQLANAGQLSLALQANSGADGEINLPGYALTLNIHDAPTLIEGKVYLQSLIWRTDIRVRPSVNTPVPLTGLLEAFADQKQGLDYYFRREGKL